MGTRVGSASENLPATDPPAVVHRDIVHASPYDMQRHWLAETVSRLNNCRILKHTYISCVHPSHTIVGHSVSLQDGDRGLARWTLVGIHVAHLAQDLVTTHGQTEACVALQAVQTLASRFLQNNLTPTC